MTKHGPLSIN